MDVISFSWQQFFATFAGNGGREMAPRHILSSRAQSDKIPTANSYVLEVKLSLSDFVKRQCVLNPRWQPNCRK